MVGDDAPPRWPGWPTSAQVTVRYAVSGSRRLAAMAGLHRLPAPGDSITFTAVFDDVGGIRHRVAELSGQPIPAVQLVWREQIRPLPQLEQLHTWVEQLTELSPAAFGAVPAWQGVVSDDAGRYHAVLLGADPYAGHPHSLHDVLAADAAGYLARPLWERLRLAASIATAVDDLDEAAIVHGAINTANVLLDATRSAVMLTGLANATVGRSGVDRCQLSDGHLAPELYDRFGVHPEVTDAVTDRWSLAVVLHHVIFGAHPYWYLTDLAQATLDADRAGPDHSIEPAHQDYRDWRRAEFAALPTAVADLFRQVFRTGRTDRQARPSAATWACELQRWAGPPQVDLLDVDRTYISPGESVTVRWRTRHAQNVLVAGPGYGVVTNDVEGSLELAPTTSGAIRLRAVGPYGTTEATSTTISVLAIPPWCGSAPTPRIRQAPAPAITALRPNLPPLDAVPGTAAPPDVPHIPVGPHRLAPRPLTTSLYPNRGVQNDQ